MRVTKTFAYIFLGLGALRAATFGLPRNVSVERAAVLGATSDDVLARAASNQGYQAFSPYTTRDPDLKIGFFGPASGVGSGFRFEGTDGTDRQTVAAVSADTVVYANHLGPIGRPAQSIIATATDAGTKVTWRIDRDMGFNPVLRVFGLFMGAMMGPTLELGLENLAAAAA